MCVRLNKDLRSTHFCFIIPYRSYKGKHISATLLSQSADIANRLRERMLLHISMMQIGLVNILMTIWMMTLKIQ